MFRKFYKLLIVFYIWWKEVEDKKFLIGLILILVVAMFSAGFSKDSSTGFAAQSGGVSKGVWDCICPLDNPDLDDLGRTGCEKSEEGESKNQCRYKECSETISVLIGYKKTNHGLVRVTREEKIKAKCGVNLLYCGCDREAALKKANQLYPGHAPNQFGEDGNNCGRDLPECKEGFCKWTVRDDRGKLIAEMETDCSKREGYIG